MQSAPGLPSGTVTLLFTDIEGSTRLLEQLRDSYGDLLADHRRLLRAAFAESGGQEIDTQGDAFFVAFSRARDAIDAAVAAQRALATHAWPAGAECRVRMGLHTGEPSLGGEGYHGLGVHRGARIAAAAHGGQILLSNTTRELVEDHLSAGMTLRSLGEQRLKDLDRPEHIYQLVVDGLPSEFPPLRTMGPAAAIPSRGRRRLSRRALALAAVAAAALAIAAPTVLLTHGGSGSAVASGNVQADSVGVFGARDGKPIAQIPVGTSPTSVALGFGSLWTANVDGHSVSRIDLATRTAAQTIRVGSGPAGIAAGAGFVWVANGLEGSVSKIDPQTNTVVQKIPVGNGPAGVAFGDGAVWVANSSDQTVTEIDPRSGIPSAPIDAGTGADGVAVGLGAVWVTSEAAGTLARIDPVTRTVVQTINVGTGADGVAVGAGAVWVANRLAGTISRVDPAANQERFVIPVGDGPSSVAIRGSTVWVSNEFAGTLSQIDALANKPVRTVRTGNRPEAVALTADAVYVAVRSLGLTHRGGTLEVRSLPGYIDSIDPATAYAPAAQQTLILTNDGLTAFRRVGGNDGARLVPDLALALPSPADGGKSYTFQLRPGIRYSTGAVVRPQDIRRGIERSLVHKDGVGTLYFSDIVGARACLKTPARCDLSRGIVTRPGASSITFRLTRPDPDLLYELALPSAFAVPSTTPLKVPHALPATGPYMIASYDAHKEMRLVRNPRFREWSPAAQPSGFPNEIVRHFATSPEAEVKAVEQGTADFAADAGSASPATLATLRSQYASGIQLNPKSFTLYIFLNTRLKPFDDVKVRQAVNFAVDRRRLIALAGGPELNQLTCQVLPPNFDGYRPYCPYTRDPNPAGTWTAPELAKARRLVTASGTKGEEVAVWGDADFKSHGGAYLVSVLKSLGYKAHFKLVGDVRTAQLRLGVEAQAGPDGWIADYAAPSGFFTGALSCRAYVPRTASSNIAAFCDRKIDAEVARARSLQTSDPRAATQLWRKVDRDVVDEAPWIAYANPVSLDFVSKRVGNYQFNPQWGALLDQLWVR